MAFLENDIRFLFFSYISDLFFCFVIDENQETEVVNVSVFRFQLDFLGILFKI